MATIVDVHEAQLHLSHLLDRVAAGERIVIASWGRPVADLVPHDARGVVPGLARGRLAWDPDTFDAYDEELAALFAPSPGS